MAINLGSNNPDDVTEQADINMTPFIDVILVLLIIFIVAAPLSTVDVPVDLPVSSAAPVQRPERPVFLTLKPDLHIAVGDDEVDRNALGAAIDTATEGKKDQRIFLRSDRTVPYGEVMAVMNLLRDAGYLKINLVGLEAPSAGPAP